MIIYYYLIFMLIIHEREKLINSIIFFAKTTKFLGKIKLCKLLYFLDFEHFKDTGRSVTGLDYFAWPMGPVPVQFYEEISQPRHDLSEKIIFSETNTKHKPMLSIKPLSEFDQTHFTKRELNILEKLAKEFKDTKAEDMIEATHLENQPWHKIYVDEKKHQDKIPYELAIRKQETKLIMEFANERDELIKHFK